jgi:hypothetical protein
VSCENPQKVTTGVCPNCGPSRIIVLLESSPNFIGISTPNWWCNSWHGQCCNCHAYIEIDFENEEDVGTLKWSFMDEDKVEFLFRDSPPT